MVDTNEKFEACSRLLRLTLANRDGVKFLPFEGLNPGLRFDFDSGNIAVHGALWSNLYFDFEAVDLQKGTPVIAESRQVSGPGEFQQLLSGLLERLST
jgi:hypothetical protein